MDPSGRLDSSLRASQLGFTDPSGRRDSSLAASQLGFKDPSGRRDSSLTASRLGFADPSGRGDSSLLASLVFVNSVDVFMTVLDESPACVNSVDVFVAVVHKRACVPCICELGSRYAHAEVGVAWIYGPEDIGASASSSLLCWLRLRARVAVFSLGRSGGGWKCSGRLTGTIRLVGG